ncbi:MAG: cyclophilin-like fold protein [Syntrophobacterales bacterium]|nr:cyclophilin-like fold protein [Syntrophobacterales bacterium]
MPVKIKIRTGSIELRGELNDSPTAQEIAKILPIEAEVQTWGDEIYFSIPVKMPLEPSAKSVVSVGDIGYWPKGNAFCLFFGPTPISKGDEIIPASAVNIVGRIEDDAKLLKNARDGEKITIERG